MFELLLLPLLTGLVLAGIHAYFGLHVLARGIIFVDLSLAQVAALGLTVAILAGHPVQSEAGYWYALALAASGAALFALVRPYDKWLPQEAVIGIVYATSAALGVLALDRAPQGAEHIKQLLIGSILTVTAEDLAWLTVLYAVIGAVHFLLRRPLIELSFDPHHAAARQRAMLLWDLFFYVSFALVLTSSVRVAGVLLVFSYLVVPASLARLWTASLTYQLWLAWGLGGVLTAVGLFSSWTWDLPTGPAIVTAFGAATAFVGLGAAARRITRRVLAAFTCGLALLFGLPLATFPQMDQPWLDAAEWLVPAVHTAFLTDSERRTRAEALVSISRSTAELARLRALEQDARWGKVDIGAEQAERLRQYLAGRSEIAAGEKLVLHHLRAKARIRQRFALGLPLTIGGLGGFYMLLRRRRAT